MDYVQTVLGKISPDELGFTLTHEHVLWDLRFYLPKDKLLIKNEDISLSNVGEMPFDRMSYPENLYQDDVGIAVRELEYYKQAGGASICDNGSYGLHADPEKLCEISKKSGVHVLKGTGRYLSYTLPEELLINDPDRLAEIFIKDIKAGVGETNVKCGFIGEIGVESGVPEVSRISLVSAAIAQKETGAPILIHQPGTERHADKIFKILTDNGANLEKVVMCHCDPYIPDADYIDHIAKCGAYISSDYFGLDIELGNKPLPTTDNDRILMLYEQIKRGNLSKILISHDTAYKFMLKSFGGKGYAHIPKRILDYMRAYGFSESWINQITITNPKEMLTIKG